ncbi:MAG: hypothetical protein ACREJ3_17975 [Polyangiaceae bacterium]
MVVRAAFVISVPPVMAFGAMSIIATACSNPTDPGPAVLSEDASGDHFTATGFNDAGFSEAGADACALRHTTAVSCGGDAGSLCPPSRPADGAPCPSGADYLECTYGDSPAAGCHALMRCDSCSQTWRTDTLRYAGGDPRCASTACPTAVPEPDAACTTSTVCDYEGGTFCECDGGPWVCSPPPATRGCPTTLPNEGVCCDPTVVSGQCDYGLVFGNCGDYAYVRCNPRTQTFSWGPTCVVAP